MTPSTAPAPVKTTIAAPRKRPSCIASPSGRHTRDRSRWWCTWCSEELGLPRSYPPHPLAHKPGA